MAAHSIVLTGFMGAGKTTVGRLLAARLGASFTDLDDLVANQAGLTIGEIFATLGEDSFRQFEALHLQQWLTQNTGRPRVLALGGGTVEAPSVQEILIRSSASVFYLEASFAELLRRCEQHGCERPLLANARQRFNLREPLYRLLAQPVATQDRSPDEVAAHILSLLEVPA